MSAGAILWFIIFLVASAIFFGVAAFAGVNGVRDLKELLAGARKKGQANDR